MINRGNDRAKVFHDDADYQGFLELLERAREHTPMRVLGYCLMPNHFHLVLWPKADGGLSTYMQWLMTSHVRRHHRRFSTSGHLWQGRFKAFPIQADGHLLTVLRYVERNGLRAGLVSRAGDWPWSSLAGRRSKQVTFIHDGPVDRPRNWRSLVNRPQDEEELTALRGSVNRGRPFGTDRWVAGAARRLGLQASLRPLGRPRKKRKK